MKTLKFVPKLIEPILSGVKTKTWRLFDDKDLQTGDEVLFLHQITLEPIAKVKLTNVVTKKFKDLTEEDWQGHERYASDQAMYDHFSSPGYYNREVNEDTELKIIDFVISKVKDLV